MKHKPRKIAFLGKAPPLRKKPRKAPKPVRSLKLPPNHYYGKIKGIGGVKGSGLATLEFEDGSSVMIDSGFGIRQLANCYEAHESKGDLLDKIRGQELIYTVDDFGILAGFSPLADFKRDYGKYLKERRNLK
jgi:hypothetical protein